MLRLEILEGPSNGNRVGDKFVVGPGGASLGRTDQCDWKLLDPDSLISRLHLRILFSNGIYELEDFSTNGSFLNDSDQAVGKGNRVPLNNGDRIRVGAYTISVSTAENPVAPAIDLGTAPGVAATAKPAAAPPPAASSADEAFGDIQAMPLSKDLLGAAPPVGSRPASQAPSPLFDAEAPPNLGVPVSNRHATDDLLGTAPPALSRSANTEPGILSVPVSPSAAPIPEAPAAEPPVPSAGLQAPPVAPGPAPSSGPAQQIPDDWFLEGDDLLGPAPAVGPEFAPAAESSPPKPEPIASQIAPAPAPATPAPPIPEAPELAANPSPPVAETAPPAQQAASSEMIEGLREALQRVVGDKARVASEQELLQVVTEIAELLAIATPQLVAALRSRTQFKESLRLRQTLIRAKENNPLKMPDAEANALTRIVLNREPGMQHGRAAVDQAFRELAQHQAALIAALRPALKVLLASLSPEAVENSASEGAGRLPLTSKRGKLWDTYSELYATLMQGDGSNAEQRFIMALADQYIAAVDTMG